MFKEIILPSQDLSSNLHCTPFFMCLKGKPACFVDEVVHPNIGQEQVWGIPKVVLALVVRDNLED